MAHKHLIYWGLISFSIFSSCAQPQKQEISKNEVTEYLTDKKYQLSKNIKKIIVITENGCPACSNALAEVGCKELADSSTLFVITARGSNVNIKPYLQMKNNVIFDWQANSSQFPMFQQTSVIYLNNTEVDTIIDINADDIHGQLDYVRGRK
jgi:DNA/RNA endonuclease YhcR with UshA esterase domain